MLYSTWFILNFFRQKLLISVEDSSIGDDDWGSDLDLFLSFQHCYTWKHITRINTSISLKKYLLYKFFSDKTGVQSCIFEHDSFIMANERNIFTSLLKLMQTGISQSQFTFFIFLFSFLKKKLNQQWIIKPC